MNRVNRTTLAGVLLLLWILALGRPQAYAYTHPCIPTTLEELNTIKASLNQEPWKSGYAKLAADGRSSLNYTMQGPFAEVGRAPNVNLNQWRNDMIAVYNLARMWYFTGNAAYAQKSRDILIAWANTQTLFSGNESGLDLGDYANAWGGGASILRGTWPGWTAADTTAVQNLFANVYWTPSAGWNVQGPANKGAIYMEAGIAIAAFCDDTAKFNQIVNQMRTFHGSGLMDTLATGQLGESGRDMGHAYGMLHGLAFVAEVAYKQGVDLFSELDNRLLACGEYYSRNSFTTDNPYVPFGSIDWYWFNNAPAPWTASRSAFYIFQNAYKNRKGLPTPWIDRKLEEPAVDATSFMYAKTADFTTATLSPATFPGVSLASSGLTLTTLGSQTSGRSVSYSNGVWTMTGLGNGTWSDTTDDCQFAYKQMTGDCAMVARVSSFTNSGDDDGKCGLMIRDNLTSTVSQRGWIAMKWLNTTSTNYVESHMRGWTENWAGAGYDDRGHVLPSPYGIPWWLKIERLGKQITVFASPDGTSWSPVSCSYYGNLPSTLYIGLFISSGNTTVNTATFDNVAFTGGTGGLVTTPAAPRGVIATASSKANTVRWLPSFGATSYNLLRSTSSGSGFTVLASNLTGTSYVDTSANAGVNSGINYYYRVQAVNSAGTSGDSMTFGSSHSLLVPRLANLGFSGTATASSYASATETPDKAFDTNPGSKWFNAAAPTGWIQKDFGAGNAQVVKRYTINSADVPARDPKDWQFQGSQDGSTWTTLDTRSGQTFAVQMAQNTYNIGNTNAYRYYRLNVTANNGATTLAVAELGLWGDSGRTIPDSRYVVVNRKSNKVMDVSGGSTANGAPLVQWTYNGGDSQQWDVSWQGNGQYRATGVASAKVIDNGGTSTAGANLVIQPWSGGSSQLWNIVPDSDGFYRFTSANSGLVADVSGGSTADGANIIQWTYSGGDSQQWMPSLASGTAPPQIPTAPTGLTATAASSSQINLSWTASSGATSYNVKRATVNGGPYTTVATGVTSTSYSDAGLAASTTYYYVVSAVNAGGESANSTQASATTLAGSPPPPAPTGLTATTASSSQINLSWTASTGATSYNVKRATVSGGPYTTVATGVTTTTYNNTGLSSGTTYYYVVSAVNAGGESANSTQASAITITAAPTGLTATAGNTQVTLNWTATTGAASYNIKRATVNGGPYTTVATGVTGTSYVNTGLVNGTAYYYVISAVNAGGESANSAQVSATPNSESILQQNTSGNDKMDVKLGQKGAQSFRHGTAGGPSYTITKLVLYLSRDAEAPNGNLVVTIGTGVNTGTVSGSSYSVTPSSVTDTSAGGSFQTYTITFATPVGPLTAGTTYHINLDAQAASNGKAYYVQYNGSSTYSNGTYFKDGSDDGKDMRFQVWGQ